MLIRAGSASLLAVLLLTGGMAFAADTPTVHQVYEAAQAGRQGEAEAMIEQVLKEHPNSAKAHYVDAELLAKAGHAAAARDQLNIAERLEPGLPFVNSQAVQALNGRIDASLRNPANVNALQNPRNGFPWGWVFLGVAALAVIGFIMRAFARRRAAAPVYPANYQGGMGPGGYAGTTAGPGMGSSVLSGLATGAALGAGMVAGEELVRHFTGNDANTTANQQPMSDSWDNDPNKQLGGTDFGMADNSSWDDGSDLADMSGGDDWS